MMVAFFQRNVAAWMDGTEGLDDGEYRVYDVVCNLIYLNNGPIVLNETGIAGRCNQHVLKFRRNFAKLVERGKLKVHPETGKITNARVEQELKKIGVGRTAKPPADPAATSALPPPGAAEVEWGSAEGRRSKPMKTKGAGGGGGRKDKTIQDSSTPPCIPPSGGKAKAAKTKVRFPESFSIQSEGVMEYAASRGIGAAEAAELFDAFRDHHVAKGNAWENWLAAWRTWVRNEFKFNRKPAGGDHGKVGSGSRQGGFSSLAARIRGGATSRPEDIFPGEPPAIPRGSH